MSQKPKDPKAFDLFSMFGLETVPEPTIDVSHLAPQPVIPTPPIDLPDLDGKRKALLVAGLGGAGKTMFLRWACQNPRMPWALLTADPVNRELVHYFPNVSTPPPSANTQDWLGRALQAFLQNQTHSMAADLGGGDTALPGLARELPGLPGIMEDAGLQPVLAVVLSPRVSDLTALKALDDAGFQPRATALVLNLGRADGVDAFRPVVSHSVFQAAADRGAAVIHMPRLFNAGPVIERRRISFAEAVDADGPLDVLDRRRVYRWLQEMDAAFAPIRSWLP